MIDLLVSGGLLFTGPLAVLALLVLAAAIRGAAVRSSGRADGLFEKRAVFHLGLFAFVFGVLGQAIGLYQMMGAIEAIGSVSPALVAGGLRVSIIAPLLGLFIFVVSMMLWFMLDRWPGRTHAGHTA